MSLVLAARCLSSFDSEIFHYMPPQLFSERHMACLLPLVKSSLANCLVKNGSGSLQAATICNASQQAITNGFVCSQLIWRSLSYSSDESIEFHKTVDTKWIVCGQQRRRGREWNRNCVKSSICRLFVLIKNENIKVLRREPNRLDEKTFRFSAGFLPKWVFRKQIVIVEERGKVTKPFYPRRSRCIDNPQETTQTVNMNHVSEREAVVTSKETFRVPEIVSRVVRRVIGNKNIETFH